MLFRLQGAATLTAGLLALVLVGVPPAMAQSDTSQGSGSTTNGEEKPADDQQAPAPEPDC